MGKLLGALIGYLMGGWLGAICGVVLGHAFDYGRPAPRWLRMPAVKWSKVRWPKIRWPQLFGKQRRETVLWAFFSVMGHLAKVDGRVSPQEIQAAEASMAALGLTPKQRHSAIKHFNRGKGRSFALNHALDTMRQQTRSRRGELHQLLEQLWLAVYADGEPSPVQLKLMQRVQQRLQLAPAEAEMIHRRVRQQKAYTSRQSTQGQRTWGQYGFRGVARQPEALAEAYRQLGVSEQDPDEVIKKAYRRLMNQHHPDKLSASGLSERALERAKIRTQEIQQAYHLIRKTRGR